MIKTGKYTGHSTGWKRYKNHSKYSIINDDGNVVAVTEVNSHKDSKLIADAPKLLAEVKQLQAWKKLVSDIVQQQVSPNLREALKELIK